MADQMDRTASEPQAMSDDELQGVSGGYWIQLEPWLGGTWMAVDATNDRGIVSGESERLIKILEDGVPMTCCGCRQQNVVMVKTWEPDERFEWFKCPRCGALYKGRGVYKKK